MYPHVRAAVDAGEVTLEWDYSKGQPTVPLVKDRYAAERRKAKELNVCIAFGTTIRDFAREWCMSAATALCVAGEIPSDIDIKEAEATMKAWFKDRPEVQKWQQQTEQIAEKKGFVRTTMGR